MAIARLSVKVGKAGKAAPHAEYIDRDEEKKLKRAIAIRLFSALIKALIFFSWSGVLY